MADDPYMILGESHRVGQQIPRTVHPLRGRIECQVIVVVPFCDDSMGLHRLVMDIGRGVSDVDFGGAAVPRIGDGGNDGSLLFQMGFLAVDRVGGLQGCGRE